MHKFSYRIVLKEENDYITYEMWLEDIDSSEIDQIRFIWAEESSWPRIFVDNKISESLLLNLYSIRLDKYLLLY